MTEPARTCRYCPAPTALHPKAVTCGGAECKRSHQRDRCRRQQRRLRSEHAARGESYRARWGWTAYGSALRRAKTAGAEWEVIDRDQVGDRDGWVCGLCAAPVVPTIRYPDPQSASLDHIVPLSLGGTRTASNVQIAHNRCNVSKKANVAWTPINLGLLEERSA